MVRRIITVAGYIGITLLVVGVTVALVAYGNDYVYDFSTRSIIQRGHVIISSVPSGIKVVADGKELAKKKTPYQAAYKVGAHTFGLVRDGYWPWQKTFEVVAGQVNLARYVILVPKNPTTTVLDKPGTVVAQAVSKDRRHLAYVTGGTTPALYTLDVSSPRPVKLYTPKPAVPPVGAEVLTGVMWSDDASHVLITSTIDGQTVYRLADAGGGEPVNLTAQYGQNFVGLTFSANNWRQLYWLTPEGLRRLDVGDQSVSSVLAAGATQFWVAASDKILYTQRTATGRSLWSLDNRGRTVELISALAESDKYAVAYATYRGEPQVAVVPASTQVGTLYTGLFGDTPVAKTLARGVTGATFSPEGHFLLFTAPNLMVSYDIEASSISGKVMLYTIANQAGTLSEVTWFDVYHLLVTRGDRLVWCEFDGANQVDLGGVAAGLPAYRTADFKALVAFRPADDGVRVVQTQIRP